MALLLHCDKCHRQLTPSESPVIAGNDFLCQRCGNIPVENKILISDSSIELFDNFFAKNNWKKYKQGLDLNDFSLDIRTITKRWIKRDNWELSIGCCTGTTTNGYLFLMFGEGNPPDNTSYVIISVKSGIYNLLLGSGWSFSHLKSIFKLNNLPFIE